MQLTFLEVSQRDILVKVSFLSCQKSAYRWNLKRLFSDGSCTWCPRQNFCCNYTDVSPTPYGTGVFQSWSDIPFINPCQAFLTEFVVVHSSRYPISPNSGRRTKQISWSTLDHAPAISAIAIDSVRLWRLSDEPALHRTLWVTPDSKEIFECFTDKMVV